MCKVRVSAGVMSEVNPIFLTRCQELEMRGEGGCMMEVTHECGMAMARHKARGHGSGGVRQWISETC